MRGFLHVGAENLRQGTSLAVIQSAKRDLRVGGQRQLQWQEGEDQQAAQEQKQLQAQAGRLHAVCPYYDQLPRRAQNQAQTLAQGGVSW